MIEWSLVQDLTEALFCVIEQDTLSTAQKWGKNVPTLLTKTDLDVKHELNLFFQF